MSTLLDTYHFDTLYGKSKDNKIKTWHISVERYEQYSDIVTRHGYSRKIETRRRITSGKNLNKANATTHYQQALSEATSKWNKKKTLENYSTEQNSFSVEISDTNISKLTIQDTHIAFPMLAQDFSKHKKKVNYPCFVQPKLDGYRMIYNTTSKSITTRQGKEFSIVKQTSKLFEELSSLPDGYILDGELYVHKNSFESFVMSGISKQIFLCIFINIFLYRVYSIYVV